MTNAECAQKIFDFLSEQTSLEDLPKADLLFVFGSVNPDVPKCTADLIKKIDVPHVLISGGIGVRGHKIDGYGSEAEWFKDVIVKSGINEDKLILETNATHTLENVLFGMQKIKDLNIEVKTVIITGYPGLLKRARATLTKHYPELEIYSHSFLPINKDLNDIKVQDRLAGEIDRLEQYYEKGDIAKVDIPEEILKCREQIRNSISSQ